MRSGKVFIHGQFVWLAWYPLRGRRCQLRRDPVRGGGRHYSIALGPLYLGVGNGTPIP